MSGQGIQMDSKSVSVDGCGLCICAQSVPRQVWLDNRTTTDLIQYPVDELQSLHGQESSYENLRVEAASSVKLNDTGGNQVISLPHGRSDLFAKINKKKINCLVAQSS